MDLSALWSRSGAAAWGACAYRDLLPFMDAAGRVFGSGWVWLVADPQGRLRIITTKEQETPLAMNLTPLLNADLWEHAYYLQYKNHRARYLDSWWNLINWAEMERRYNDRVRL